jgi:hypothetical protein
MVSANGQGLNVVRSNVDQDDRRKSDPYGLGRWRQQVEAQVREHAAKCGARNCTASSNLQIGNLQIDEDRLEARLRAERRVILDLVTQAITEFLAQERRRVMRGCWRR